MKEVIKKNWLYILASILISITGIVMLIFPEISMKIFFKILGGVVCVFGFVSLILYIFKSKDGATLFQLISGVLTIILGVALLFSTESMIGLVTLIIGIVFAFYSVIIFGFSFLLKNITKYWIVLFLISIICLGLSVAIIIAVEKSLGIVFGLTLIMIGLQTLFATLFFQYRLYKMKKVYDDIVKEGKMMEDDIGENNGENNQGGVYETTINE